MHCSEMCQVIVLQSLSTYVTCYKDNVSVECNQSVVPGVMAIITCKLKYNLETNAQTVFVCQQNGQWNGQRTECTADCGKLIPSSLENHHEIPWAAGIYYKNEHICGGTIISGLFINFKSYYSLFWDFLFYF